MTKMASPQFCLRWNNHQVNMLDVFDKLYSSEALVDVTLACEGVSIKAHKVILSACSSFFQDIFINNPCKHPVVILKDIKVTDLRAVLQFMYRGEVNVTQDQLPSIIKIAESLKVKGLAEMNSSQLNSLNCARQLKSDKVTSNTTVAHNSVAKDSFQESDNRSSDSNNCADQNDVLTDESVSDSSPKKFKEPVKVDSDNMSQSDSHPQLSALLDSTHLKPEPPSPSASDQMDDDGFVVDGGYSAQDQMENHNMMLAEEVRLGDAHLQGPMIKVSDLSHNAVLNSDFIISSQGSELQRQNPGLPISATSWYQQWRTKRKRYKRYTQETLDMAIAAVLQKTLSQKRAAIIYGIPHETLRRHVKDRRDLFNGGSVTIDDAKTNGIDTADEKCKDEDSMIKETVRSITIIPDEHQSA